MADQPIPIETANEMMDEYISYMKAHSIDMEHQTQNVSFDLNKLTEWIKGIAPYSDNLKICMGVYKTGEQAGRITTIIWPYKGDSPAAMPVEARGPNPPGPPPPGGIQPYNEGTGTP